MYIAPQRGEEEARKRSAAKISRVTLTASWQGQDYRHLEIGDGEVLRLQRTTESTEIPTGDPGGTLLGQSVIVNHCIKRGP